MKTKRVKTILEYIRDEGLNEDPKVPEYMKILEDYSEYLFKLAVDLEHKLKRMK